jgi:tetratricopeptide (TPR) repeat protein/predicted Ser/Thr protein kinase
MVRGLLTCVALVSLALAAWSLGATFAPDVAVFDALDAALRGGFKAAGLAKQAQLLVGVVPGGALAALGVACAVGATKLPRGGAGRGASADSSGVHTPQLDRKTLRKVESAAGKLAKQGDPISAGELCAESGLHDLAVQYFSQAREFAKAAEVRRDQLEFEQAAALYEQAGRFESAASLYASRSVWDKAADAYRKAGKMSVAGEMYEKAGRHKEAGDCYMRCEFYRHAAQQFLQVQDWKRAAQAVEKALEDELNNPASQQDREKQKALKKLVLQSAKLHEQAGDVESALRVLTQGEAWAAGAELADRAGLHERAADLYQRAGNVPKAAEALRKLGENAAAAQMLGEYLRDKGDDEEAARLLAEAGDLGSAADLYRKLEDWKRAGEAYERGGDTARAAEMFRLSEDWDRAAVAFERARQYREAAECAAQLGDAQREARYLAQSGAHLAAARTLAREGHDEDSIKLLQQVAPDAPDFCEASALLGEIFRKKGKHGLAQKKLEQAIAGAPLSAANAELYYQLASTLEAQGQAGAALDVYEKILAIDFHFRDVDARLEALRPLAAAKGASSGVPGVTDSKSGGPRPARYRIDRELGRGGMGIVYKATDLVLDRPVALKVLPDQLRDNPQALRNFIREAKAAAKMNHPNIVTVYDAGEQDGRTFIAMEYVDGTTLKAIVKQRGPLAPRAIVHVLAQVSEGLAYAHARKIVHRDIKTANLMWTREKKAKIMDFGLAKVVEEVLNHTTLVSGTPYYMSPEQTEGTSVDHRSDLYSLGVTAFELATGSVPFKEGNVPYHHVHTTPPDPRSLRADLPGPLAELILRCLEKSPEARPQDAQEMLLALRGITLR